MSTPTNCTSLKETVIVPASQIPFVVENSIFADIDLLVEDVQTFFEELISIAEQRFVMMKNK